MCHCCSRKSLHQEFHPAARRGSIQCDTAPEGCHVSLLRIRRAKVQDQTVCFRGLYVLEHFGTIDRTPTLLNPVRNWHGMSDRRGGRVLEATFGEVHVCVATGSGINDQRLAARVDDQRANIIVVVHLVVMATLDGHDEATWIGRFIPRDHPLEPGPPVVGTRREKCDVGGIDGPQEAADGPATRTSAWIDRLICGEANELGYVELPSEEGQESGFESNTGT